jgi:hypothetical protein
MMVAAQCLFAIAAISIMPFVPAKGAPLLLVPLNHAAAMDLATRALKGGALILAPGPIGGTLIVRGELGRLSDAVHAGEVLVVAAPPAICGDLQ